MAKRKTLYELAQKYYAIRVQVHEAEGVHTGLWGIQKARLRRSMHSADAALYEEGAFRAEGALLPAVVVRVRAETLDELEALARKRGDGLFDVLEILAIMRSNHGKT